MLPQADSEFDRCIQRRGEALALFLDEEPTYAFFPPVYYYRGRVREAMNTAGIRRFLPRLPEHPRQIDRGSAGARRPPPRGCREVAPGLTALFTS